MRFREIHRPGTLFPTQLIINSLNGLRALAATLILGLAPCLAADSNWYLQGRLQAGLFLDSIYTDPYLRAARTPVFGKDGSNNPDADNTCIPRDLDDDGEVIDCRPLYGDYPVFSGTFSGSRLRVGHRRANHDIFVEGILEGDRSNPYQPSIYRAWADYKDVGLGYGWSTFGDFQQDFYPQFVDYNGPVGVPYKRQFLLRLRFGRDYYLAFEEPKNEVYRGFGLTGTTPASSRNSDTVYNSPKVHRVTLQGGQIRRYEIDRQLRTRGVLPDLVFTYYRKRDRNSWFISTILRYVRLDNNAPLFFEEDAGLEQLRRDAADDSAISGALGEELRLNDDISNGMDLIAPGFHLGRRWSFLTASAIQLAYIYNGGSYLRDNPNPSYLVVPNNIIRCEADTYDLVPINTHSYVFGVDFGPRFNLLLGGTLTENDQEIWMGGGATSSLHSLHFNYLQQVQEGLDFVYEIGYLYHETFNGRNNANYPRVRMQYGVSYSF